MLNIYRDRSSLYRISIIAIIAVLLLAFHLNVCYAAIPDKILNQQKSVVMIEITENNKVISIGTGFFIDSSGIIVTNYHVVSDWFEGSDKIAIAKLENGAFIILDGLIAIDKDNDIALVKAKVKNVPTVHINRQARAKKGDDVYVIGSPLGLDASLSEGIISNIRTEMEVIQITAPISPGSSGSPVYNSRGEVIGIATFQAKTGQNLNFAVPMSKAFRLFDKNRRAGLLARPVSPKKPAATTETLPNPSRKKVEIPDDGRIVHLRFSNFFPAPHKNSILAQQYCKEIETRSRGKIKIAYYPGGTLVPAAKTFDGVVNGTTDIGESCFAYTRGKFPMMEILDLPLGYISGMQATRLANAYYKRFRPKELDNVKVLFLHGHGPAIFHTTFPVITMDDLRSRKIRGTGMGARIIQALGARPVGTTMGETYDAIRTGVAEGAFAPSEALMGWKWAEVLKFTTRNLASSYTTGMFVIMNKDKWNSLPLYAQQLFDEVSEEWITKQGLVWDEIDREGLRYLERNNGQVVNLSDVEEKRWRIAVRPLLDEFERKRGLTGREAINFCLKYLGHSY